MSASLLSSGALGRLMAFSKRKKVAFLLLLQERQSNELYRFCDLNGIDDSFFLSSRNKFFTYLVEPEPDVNWARLRDSILELTPRSEEFETLLAYFALNAALVMSETAAYISDGMSTHILDAMRYAAESLHAKVSNDLGLVVYSEQDTIKIDSSLLMERERQMQEGDVEFLAAMTDFQWTSEQALELEKRARDQPSMLSGRRMDG